MLFPEKPQHDVCGELHSALTEREIVAQSMTFLLAGYETTSAVLAYLCHELAKHPDIQERLYREIVDNVGAVRKPFRLRDCCCCCSYVAELFPLDSPTLFYKGAGPPKLTERVRNK